MVAAEPGPDEITIDPVAGSSGGTWDVLPRATDTGVLGSLLPIHEYDLMESDSPIEIPPATPVD
jgi:hypothetical protein